MATEAEHAGGASWHRPLFVTAILTGSFLLFLVQPMIARMALPRLGGAPAVWNSAMLVYQALLLAGYAYAHVLSRVPVRGQGWVHLAVLALALLWLPIRVFAMQLPADAEPALWVPWLFVASIGPLFFAISAQAPLLQRWYSSVSGGRDPYALYAASNFGSFVGLIAYPLIVEPGLTLKGQSLLWTGGYVLVFALVATCALTLPRQAAGVPHVPHTSPAPGWLRWLHWVVLGFVPSGLMLATSTFITTDIVAVPLLWVLPLGLYLLSFTLAFATRRGPAETAILFAPVVVLLCGTVVMLGNQDRPFLSAFLALGLLFIVSIALHARLYELRPAPDRLTGFYLALSLGGALGGIFAGLVAPILFDWTYEYPLLVLAAGLLIPQLNFVLPFIGSLWRKSRRAIRIQTIAIILGVALILFLALYNPGGILGRKSENIGWLAIALLGLVAIGQRGAYMVALIGAMLVYGGVQSLEQSIRGVRTRSYFGVYTVQNFFGVRTLSHGTTVHGVERQPPFEREPTSYYVPPSGIGRAMRAVPDLFGPNARIGVVGLGSGTLACYSQPGQHWRFYEIDPTIIHIARDSGKFHFLPLCMPHPEIAIGDARLRIAETAPGSLEVLVLDAFSSDAVPMHLLTNEAFESYGRALAPNGLLLVHISNRFLALSPVVAAAAQAGGWHAARLFYTPGIIQRAQEATASDWIAMSRDRRTLERLVARGGAWEPLRTRPGFTGWSDDYATILPLLRVLHPGLGE